MAQKRFPQGSGPSQRQLRVGELIRRRLSEVLARGDVHDPDLNRMVITVGEVTTSPDLKIATAYVMPLGGKGREDVLLFLRRNRSELRRLVAGALALKFAPELRFELDETFDRMDATRELFDREEVRRDLDADEDDDNLEVDDGGPTMGPRRNASEDRPRDVAPDSDEAFGGADWEDTDEDQETEDFDIYRDGDDDRIEPLDHLIRSEQPSDEELERLADARADGAGDADGDDGDDASEDDRDADEDDDEDEEGRGGRRS